MTTIGYIILALMVLLNGIMFATISGLVAEKRERDKWLARYLSGGPHSMN